MKLGEFLNSINYTKTDVFQEDTEYVTKKYTPFVINRFLSYFPDTIIHVNEMNRLSVLDKKMQYDYLRLSIRKRKRFSKWLKEEYPEDLECVKQYFGYSNEKAKQVLDLLDAEMIATMKEELDEGGVR
jgi:hypothetical protein